MSLDLKKHDIGKTLKVSNSTQVLNKNTTNQLFLQVEPAN